MSAHLVRRISRQEHAGTDGAVTGVVFATAEDVAVRPVDELEGRCVISSQNGILEGAAAFESRNVWSRKYFCIIEMCGYFWCRKLCEKWR